LLLKLLLAKLQNTVHQAQGQVVKQYTPLETQLAIDLQPSIAAKIGPTMTKLEKREKMNQK